jgi:hypothetical protein
MPLPFTPGFHGIRNLFPHPVMFSTELIYSILIIAFCLTIYIKTKDIFKLTSHKGIGYFRDTFLFFAIAYFIRFLFQLFRLTTFALDMHVRRQFMGPYPLVIIGYLSTIAIFSLTLSTVSRFFKKKHINIFAHVIAITVAITIFMTRSPEILVLTQFILLILAIVMSFFKYRKSKRLSSILIIYPLLFVFWILNLADLGPRIRLPPVFMIISNLISIAVFAFIYYKVHKWVK